MPRFRAWRVLRVESAAVVLHGEEELPVFEASRDLYGLRLSVAERVDGEFADDADYRVCGVLGEALPGNGEAHSELRVADVRGEDALQRRVHRRFVECLVAEVPDAVPYLVAA